MKKILAIMAVVISTGVFANGHMENNSGKDSNSGRENIRGSGHIYGFRHQMLIQLNKINAYRDF